MSAREVKFRPLLPVTELSSPFDSGAGYWIAVAGAAVLSSIILAHLFILLKLLGL